MAVIDFHTHILPEMDDGSRNIDTSLEMLRMSAAQGTDLALATPHFYASQDRVEEFLERRSAAFARLEEKLDDGMPEIRLGAEVAWFDGISRADQIEKLTVEGSRTLLLELPFEQWSDAQMEELHKLAGKYQIVLAHLERYLAMPANIRKLGSLSGTGICAQVNAGSLLDWKRRGKALKLFRNGQAQLLGSDCHGVHHRPPNLGAGRSLLEKKFGSEFLARMDETGARLTGCGRV